MSLIGFFVLLLKVQSALCSYPRIHGKKAKGHVNVDLTIRLEIVYTINRYTRLIGHLFYNSFRG